MRLTKIDQVSLDTNLQGSNFPALRGNVLMLYKSHNLDLKIAPSKNSLIVVDICSGIAHCMQQNCERGGRTAETKITKWLEMQMHVGLRDNLFPESNKRSPIQTRLEGDILIGARRNLNKESKK